MDNFVMDPLLLTCPDAKSDRIYVSTWIKALEAWLNEIESTHFNWRHFKSCTDILHGHAQAANFANLRSLSNHFHLDINVAILGRRINAFFEDESLDFMCQCMTEDVCPTNHGITVIPDEVILRNQLSVQSELRRSLLIISCDKATEQSFANDVCFITLPLQSDATHISVVSDVYMILPDDLIIRMGSSSVDQELPIVIAPDDLFSDFDGAMVFKLEQHVWSRAISSIALRSSTDVLRDFRFGNGFSDSLSESAILDNQAGLRSLFRACVAVVSDRAKHSSGLRLEQVRRSKSGTSHQNIRRSDKAKAWRATLTMGGAGWRLHYWEVPSSADGGQFTIEFHNVTRHDGLM